MHVKLSTCYTKPLLWLVWCLMMPSMTSAQQDTLILKNNDRIVGEIKVMTNGVLTIEPDYSDQDFKVTWLDVISVKSPNHFLISLEEGARFNGTVHTAEGDSARVTVADEQGNKKTVRIEEVVYLKPIEDSFLSRLDASLSVGFNFAKSNRLRQFTIRSLITYSAERWNFKASYNTILSEQEEVEQTRRTDANLGANYLLKDDWFAALNADFLSNDEQQLELRIATSALIGSYLIHSNQVYMAWGAGLAWNNEKFNDEFDTVRNSLEGVLGLQFDAFDTGDLSLFSSIYVYPSLTESDRIRYDFKLDFKYDLPYDFFIKLGYTQNFDSQPIADASKNDYVLQTTFGWEL